MTLRDSTGKNGRSSGYRKPIPRSGPVIPPNQSNPPSNIYRSTGYRIVPHSAPPI